MGCATFRPVQNEEEATLVEQESRLNYQSHSAVHLDYILRKNAHEGRLNAAQFAAATATLGLRVENEGPSSRIAAFYEGLKKAGHIHLKDLLVIALLLGAGQTKTKAELAFDLYDQDATDNLTGSSVRLLLGDLFEIAVVKLPELVGPNQNGAADPTSVKYYIDRLSLNRKSTDDKLVAAFLEGKHKLTKAEFIHAFEHEDLRFLLSSSGFRNYYFKEYQKKTLNTPTKTTAGSSQPVEIVETIDLVTPGGKVRGFISARAGAVNPDSVAFNDIQEHGLDATSHIDSISVAYENAIVGLTIAYKTASGVKNAVHLGSFSGAKTTKTLKLDEDEYITKVSGRAGKFLDHLTITTNSGAVIDEGGQGGSPFTFNIPHHHVVVGFTGGIGGHLHNLAVVYRPSYYWTPPVKAPTFGPTHDDTKPWDHLPLIVGRGEILSARIAEIHVLYRDFVVGLNIIYEVNGEIFAVQNFGSDAANEQNIKEELILSPHEYIIEVTGRGGGLIDQLTLKTNRNKTVSWGGSGGSEFKLEIPEGKRVVAFNGGTNGHLHNVGVYFN